MSVPQIVRPAAELSEDTREEMRSWLHAQWLRAESSRREQVDGQYSEWDKAYYGIPLEEVRTVPFYKASNFVVKLVRMFLDTFVARTLNIIFATRPLFVVDVLPRELRDAAELYINRKALYDWEYYRLVRELCFRGNKNGTVVTKTIYEERETYDVMMQPDGGMKEEKFIHFAGPSTKIIPFEDFYLYPITANCLAEAQIKFQRVRYTKERAEYLEAKAYWKLPEGKTINDYVRMPRDVKRTEAQSEVGVYDSHYEELDLVECHFDYSITNDKSKLYNCVAVIDPASGDLFDVYYNPYPRNLCLFNEYRPYPREEIFYGESMCQLLGQSQEESSRIHNERRDNSMLANTMCFKRRSGSLIPNPSTNWYPGKVWDLEDMTDLEVFDIGRNYNSTIEEENYAMTLAEKLSGIDGIKQGMSQGSMGKGGVYNTMGTLAVMSEGNQRQDTNIRDVRETVSSIVKTDLKLQATFGKDDPLIDIFEEKQQMQIRAALEFFASDKWRYAKLEVKSSSAGVNKEVERANLLQMATIVNQYGQATMGMAQQLLNPQINPGLRAIMNDQLKMMREMAVTIMKSADEFELAEDLPDVRATIEASLAGGSGGAQASGTPPGGLANGSAPGALSAIQRLQVSATGKMPPSNGAPAGPPSMGPPQ